LGSDTQEVGASKEPAPDRAIRMIRDVTGLAERLASQGVFVARLDVDYSSALWQLEVRDGAAEDARRAAPSSSELKVERFRFFWSSRDQELILSISYAGVLSSNDKVVRRSVLACESLEESLRLTEQLVAERLG